MQSWGTKSHFETRHTDYYPSKSAVIGLIAASLGLQRDEDTQIQRLNELKFAVRVDQQGNLLRDYHTAQKFKKDGSFERTYVTERYYLEDYVFVVGIEHEDEQWMSDINVALKNPYFQPFLGRRSNPLTLDFFIGKFEDSLMEVMGQYSWQASEWYKRTQRRAAHINLELYVDNLLSSNSVAFLRQDRVVSFSQKERKFGFRYESRQIVVVPNDQYEPIQLEHDIIEAIGG